MAKVDWKVSDAKRLLRAVQKQGLANRPMTISKQPDGTLTIKIARASDSEPPDREGDDPAKNEWD